jgi:hypothetical protein
LRRIALAAAALASAAALSACGDGNGGQSAPQGPPAARHGEQPILVYQRIERVRARLVAASDLYFLRRIPEARAQLAIGGSGYRSLSAGVRREDALLDREILAAFPAVDRLMLQGVAFDTMRDRLSPLLDQLLGGAAAVLIPAGAREDRGLQAEALSRLLEDLNAEYSRSQRASGPEADRTLEYAYGLLARAQSVARGLSESLGPKKDQVTEGIAGIRDDSFPDNLLNPTPRPVAEVDASVGNVQRALEQRFRLP